jgi:hypothetical protein
LSGRARIGPHGERRGGIELIGQDPDAATRRPIALSDGHYTGTTTHDEPISFDVVLGGSALTNLSFMIKASCDSNSQLNIVDEPITITGFFPIGLDGSFDETVTGTDIKAMVSGTVASSATSSDSSDQRT